MNVNIGADMLRKSAGIIEERQKVYGSPNENFRDIATFWTAWLVARYGEVSTTKLDEVDVAVMMDDVKKARLAKTPDHEDSWVDKAGYAACGLQVSAKPEPEPMPNINHDPLPYWNSPADAVRLVDLLDELKPKEEVGWRTEPFLPVEQETTGPLVRERTEPSWPVRRHEDTCNIFIGDRCTCSAMSEQANKVE